MRVTEGYPYFLQEWGKHTWQQARGPEIKLNDVLAATQTARAALESNFFRVRFDRLTPREQAYRNTMAEAMGLKVERTVPLLSGLIHEEMVWSPAHGMTAFMRRAMAW